MKSTAGPMAIRPNGPTKEPYLRQQLQATGLSNLFHELDSSGTSTFTEKHWQKLLTATEGIRKNEPFMFSRAGPSIANFLTYLYVKLGRISQAKARNEEVLNASPDDLTARISKFELLLKEKKLTAAAKQLADLQKPQAQDKLLEVKADIAYSLSCLGPQFYHAAVKKYESVLPEGLLLSSRWLCGCYQLATVHNKLLSKSVGVQYDETKAYSPLYHIQCVCRLLYIVIQSRDEVLEARSWADLGYAIKRFEDRKGIRVDLAWAPGCSPDACMKKAMKLAPECPHVLEMIGRHERGKGNLSKALSLLEKANRAAPQRHVAVHHLGHLHREMWQREMDERSHVRKGKRAKQRGKFKHSISAPALELRQSEPVPCEEARRLWEYVADPGVSSSGVTQPTVQKAAYNSRWCNRKANWPQVINTPDFVTDHLVQANQYFESASEMCEGTNCRYLVDLSRTQFSLGNIDEALECLQRAEFLMEEPDALRNRHVHGGDAMYLYEQWAVQLEASCICQSEDEIDDLLASVKDKYRLAIENAVKMQTAPPVAFHALKNILNGQRRDCSEDDATLESIESEQILLEILMGRHGVAERMQQKAEQRNHLLATDIDRMAYQVEILVQKKQFSAAYTFLTALLCEHEGRVPERMDMGQVLLIARNAARRKSHAGVIYRDIVERFLPKMGEQQVDEPTPTAAEDHAVNTGDIVSVPRMNTLDLTSDPGELEDHISPDSGLGGTEPGSGTSDHNLPMVEKPVLPGEQSDQRFCEEYDLVLLTRDGYDAMVSRIHEHLEGCGLKVFLAATDPDSNATNVPTGTNTIDSILEKCQPSETRGVVIVARDFHPCHGLASHIVGIIPYLDDPPRICCLVDNEEAPPTALAHYQRVPVPNIIADGITPPVQEERLEQLTWDVLGTLILGTDNGCPWSRL